MNQKSAAGFSIVELILAIVVGVSFIASLNLVTDNYTTLGKRARNLVLVNSYAEAKVEGLRNTGYNSLNPGTSDITSELPSQLPGRSGSLTVTQEPDGIKQLDLAISYKDGTIDRDYTYRTYIGELGVGQ
jgi:type II secretory pathway pseudopilin PulG